MCVFVCVNVLGAAEYVYNFAYFPSGLRLYLTSSTLLETKIKPCRVLFINFLCLSHSLSLFCFSLFKSRKVKKTEALLY